MRSRLITFVALGNICCRSRKLLGIRAIVTEEPFHLPSRCAAMREVSALVGRQEWQLMIPQHMGVMTPLPHHSVWKEAHSPQSSGATQGAPHHRKVWTLEGSLCVLSVLPRGTPGQTRPSRRLSAA